MYCANHSPTYLLPIPPLTSDTLTTGSLLVAIGGLLGTLFARLAQLCFAVNCIIVEHTGAGINTANSAYWDSVHDGVKIVAWPTGAGAGAPNSPPAGGFPKRPPAAGMSPKVMVWW